MYLTIHGVRSAPMTNAIPDGADHRPAASGDSPITLRHKIRQRDSAEPDARTKQKVASSMHDELRGLANCDV
jgi:hypothetical protein